MSTNMSFQDSEALFQFTVVVKRQTVRMRIHPKSAQLTGNTGQLSKQLFGMTTLRRVQVPQRRNRAVHRMQKPEICDIELTRAGLKYTGGILRAREKLLLFLQGL